MLYWLPSFLISTLPVISAISSTSELTSSLPNVNNNGIVTLPVLPHQHVVNRHLAERGLANETDDTEQIAGLYQGYGTHYVDLWIGTPKPQRQTVIVDTGSQITAFPCVECVDCGEKYHTDSYFDFKKSESFHEVSCDECKLGHCYTNKNGDKCEMGLSYQEGSSWKAYESTDTTYAGGLHDKAVQGADTVPTNEKENPNGLVKGQMPQGASDYSFELHFGCENHITGLFKTQLADGIMGMSNDNGAYWKQMYTAGAISNQQFALCFRRESDSEKDGTAAGAMTLGGTNSLFHDTPMVYTKSIRSRGFFTVEVKAMYMRTNGGLVAWDEDDVIHKLDAEKNALNTGAVIVDSGTTDTYLNRKVMEPFMNVWKDITGFEYKNSGLKLTDEQLELLPTILVQLDGDDINEQVAEQLGVPPENIPGLAASVDPENPFDILIAITPMHYMEFDPDDQAFASRLYVDERSGSVLGANTMQGHDVFFDVDNSRIGWAESDCAYMEVTGQVQFAEKSQKKVNDGEKDESSTSEASKPFGEAEHNANDARFCSSPFCRSASLLGLGLAAFQGVAAWKCFRARVSRQAIPTEETNDVLHDFDTDIRDEDFSPVEDNELL